MFLDFLHYLPLPIRYVIFYVVFAIGIFSKPSAAILVMIVLLVLGLLSPGRWLEPWGQEPVKRKRVLVIYGLPLVLFGILALGMSPGSDGRFPRTRQVLADRQQSAAPASGKTSTEAKRAESSAKPKSAPAAAPAKPVLDTRGTASRVNFQVVGLKLLKSIGDRKTANLFVVPRIAVMNNQRDAIELSSSLFTLQDEQGREFSPLVMESIMLENNHYLEEPLNPGLTATVAIVFEVPTTVNSLTIVCQGGLTGSRVSLRLDPPQSDKAKRRNPVIGLHATVANDTKAYRVTTPGASPAFSLKRGDIVIIEDEDNRGMFFYVKFKDEEGFDKRSDLRVHAD